jgi:hypothetical protein
MSAIQGAEIFHSPPPTQQNVSAPCANHSWDNHPSSSSSLITMASSTFQFSKNHLILKIPYLKIEYLRIFERISLFNYLPPKKM